MHLCIIAYTKKRDIASLFKWETESALTRGYYAHRSSFNVVQVALHSFDKTGLGKEEKEYDENKNVNQKET